MRAETSGQRAGRRALLIAAALGPVAAMAADDPRPWLERMSRAVEQLSYEGTLVHIIGSDANLLRVVHRVRDGVVQEKVTADGSGREIIRDGDKVMCILPDQRTVLVGNRDHRDRAQSPLQGRLPGTGALTDGHYHLAFAGSERVAGRDTRVIVIRPRDSFRYGYRLSLDRVTAMPLKTQLIDAEGAVPEQVLFSTIVLRNDIPDDMVAPSSPIVSFAVQDSLPGPAGVATRVETGWAVTRLPEGFRLEARRTRSGSGADRALGHLVYSDGLATVSLFIEPAVAASEQVEGLSQMGAANAYTVVHEGFMVTAVGEVPAVTVQLLAESARPSPTP
jgi:sigma-E factor negative regulatory protein RseB